MTTRPLFRISKSPTNMQQRRRTYSQQNKEQSDTISSQFNRGSHLPKRMIDLSPRSTTKVRKNILKIQQQRSITKITTKNNTKFLKSQMKQELVSTEKTHSNSHISKNQSFSFNLMMIPIQQDKVSNLNEFRKQKQTKFSDKTQLRKYSQVITITTKDQKQIISFDTLCYNNIQKILQQLQAKLIKGNINDIIRKYIETISKGTLDQYYQQFKVQYQKMIKTFILYERVIVLLVAVNDAIQRIETNQSFLFNSLKCCLDNRVMILSLLQTVNDNPNPSTYSNSSDLLRNMDRQVRNYEIVRHNNDIILNLIYKLSKDKNYFTQHLKSTLKQEDISIKKQFKLLLEYLSFMLHLNGLQDKLPFIALAPAPYLKPTKKYTLVIDIMKVMYNSQSQCFRPNSQKFIQQLSQFYQIISYSALLPKQMQAFIRFIDRKNVIAHKLYQQHFIKQNNIFKKDISRLGRSLLKTILIDIQYGKSCFQNTLIVGKWQNNADDKLLLELIFFLFSLSTKNQRVQQSIVKFNSQEFKNRSRKYTFDQN